MRSRPASHPADNGCAQPSANDFGDITGNAPPLSRAAGPLQENLSRGGGGGGTREGKKRWTGAREEEDKGRRFCRASRGCFGA